MLFDINDIRTNENWMDYWTGIGLELDWNWVTLDESFQQLNPYGLQQTSLNTKIIKKLQLNTLAFAMILPELILLNDYHLNVNVNDVPHLQRQ